MLLSLALLVPLLQTSAPQRWDAALLVDDEGTRLPFGLELREDAGGWSATLVNDPERIDVPEVDFDGTSLVLGLPHYRSEIRAELEGNTLQGTWTKVRGRERIARVPFVATPRAQDRTGPAAARPGEALPSVDGRWSVDFEADDLPAVGSFRQAAGSTEVRGTFLTATGDYRFLYGALVENRLTLSCFDGAHAFLFEAELRADGSLAGSFRSGNWWTESWTAVRDDEASVVDAFAQTTWDERVSRADLSFPDPTGAMVSLADPTLAGRATLLVLFGSWCPNCHDEAPYLVELHERYADRGLSIVGLAFELTGSFEEDARQVERFRDKYQIPYPLLIGGTSDKGTATAAFGALDFLRSYPTTVFLAADGSVRAVHSGYAGPATGEAHAALREEFESTIESLLSEPPARTEPIWSALVGPAWTTWGDERGSTTYVFHGDATEPRARVTAAGRPAEERTVTLVGDGVWIGDALWRFDRTAGVLLDPRRFGARLVPAGDPTPLLTARGITGEAAVLNALTHEDAEVRREAVFACTLSYPEAPPAGVLALLASDEVELVRAAAWSVGRRRIRAGRDALADLRTHPHAGVRREVARALVALAEEDPGAAELLGALAEDPDPVVRRIAEQADEPRD